MEDTSRRREKQIQWNLDNGFTPTQIQKGKRLAMGNKPGRAYVEIEKIEVAADPIVQYMSKEALQKNIENTRKLMEKAAKDLDFIEAARYRDEVFELEKLIQAKFSSSKKLLKK